MLPAYRAGTGEGMDLTFSVSPSSLGDLARALRIGDDICKVASTQLRRGAQTKEAVSFNYSWLLLGLLLR